MRSVVARSRQERGHFLLDRNDVNPGKVVLGQMRSKSYAKKDPDLLPI